MNPVQEHALTTSHQPDPSADGGTRVPAQVPLWPLNLLRVGYIVMGGGMAAVRWPLL